MLRSSIDCGNPPVGGAHAVATWTRSGAMPSEHNSSSASLNLIRMHIVRSFHLRAFTVRFFFPGRIHASPHLSTRQLRKPHAPLATFDRTRRHRVWHAHDAPDQS